MWERNLRKLTQKQKQTLCKQKHKNVHKVKSNNLILKAQSQRIDRIQRAHKKGVFVLTYSTY